MDDLIGKIFGNYRLMRLLGQGGFAQVYLAEHPDIGIQAAIKVLHPSHVLGSEAQFRSEAQTIANLAIPTKHPHIVHLTDYGSQNLGDLGARLYLVMEYAPNGTLRQRHKKRTQVPPETLLPYVKQAAEALFHAHSQEVIHRDVKPENLLLGPGGEVLLSDFGIARKVQTVNQPEDLSTPGTPAYMAPEQLLGKPELASDQYALGIVVYEWLAGDPPFQGTSFLEVAHRHIHEPPPPLRSRVPTLSAAIEAVVEQALAKAPAKRFPSVRAFASALEQAIYPSPGTLFRIYRRHSETSPGQARSISGEVWALAWSPDGQEIASGGVDGKIHLWDASSAQPRLVYPAHRGQVLTLSYSRDEKYLASGSDDKTVKVWEVASGACQATFYSHRCRMISTPVYALAWSPDGQQLAYGGEDKVIRLWNVLTKAQQVLYKHEGPVRGLAWSPDGQLLASGSDDKHVFIWEVAAGRRAAMCVGHDDWVNAVAWSPDGRRVASASKDQTARVWNSSGGQVSSYRDHHGGINALAWSLDGELLASGGDDLTVQVWEATSGRPYFTYADHLKPENRPADIARAPAITALAWSPDGRRIASAGTEGIILVWQAR